MTSKQLRNYRVVEWRRRIKKRAIEYLGGKCVRCGYDRCPDAMDFHHRDADQKDFGIGGYNGGWDKIKEELDKCDLLCANCHREVHAEEKAKVAEEQKRAVEASCKSAHLEVFCSRCGSLKRITPSRVNATGVYFCSRVCLRNPPKSTAQPKVKISYPAPKQLGEMLRTQPATEIARALGVTGTALKKHCVRNNIPTSPRGHWRKNPRL